MTNLVQALVNIQDVTEYLERLPEVEIVLVSRLKLAQAKKLILEEIKQSGRTEQSPESLP